MPNPKRKHSKSRRDLRRHNVRVAGKNLSPCPQCSALRQSHMACPECGYYKGVAIAVVREKPAKKKEAA